MHVNRIRDATVDADHEIEKKIQDKRPTASVTRCQEN
jgi:hypothetical protein